MELIRCFFFNDTATTEIYTLSLHDALPIFVYQIRASFFPFLSGCGRRPSQCLHIEKKRDVGLRSEEHTSELQSRQYLVCCILPEKNRLVDHEMKKLSSEIVTGKATTLAKAR